MEELRQLALLSGLSALVLVLVSLVLLRIQRGEPGLRDAAIGAVSLTVSMVLVSLQGHIPVILSTVLVSSLAVLTVGLVYSAISRLLGGPPRYRAVATATAASLVFGVVFNYVWPSPTVRVVGYSVLFAYGLVLLGWVLLRQIDPQLRMMGRISAALFFLGAVLYGLRAGFALLGMQQPGQSPPAGFTSALPFVYTIVFTVWLSALLTSLVGLRIQRELTAARDSAEAANLMLRRAATTDSVTGIGNRVKLEDDLASEVARAARYAMPLSVIMIDFDNFKSINDSMGHNIGDDVLRGAAEILSKKLRHTDVIGRWGGDEFLVLLPETETAAALAAAAHLQAALREVPLLDTEVVTASFGIASYRPSDTARTLVSRADEAMYRAKSSGRDCAAVV